MRALSYILIVLGFFLLVEAGYQEYRGSTTRPLMYLPFTKRSFMERRHNRRYQMSIPVLKNNNPALFREFMETHWIYAVVFEVAGWLCYVQSKD